MERPRILMTGQSGVDVAIMLHDLAETGVARNAVAIAMASHLAGLRTEIWAVDASGPLIAHVPDGVGIIALGSQKRKWGNRRLADVAAIGELARVFRQRKPSVALSAGNHFHITASAGYFLAGSPVSSQLLFRASNPPFQGRNIRVGFFLAWLYRLRFRGAHRIISVSDELRELLVNNIRIDPARVVTIANGIDIKLAKERAAKAPEHPWFGKGEPPVVLGIGRIAPQKNFSLLIRAFAEMRKAQSARLMIIGRGGGAELAKLQALAASLDLKSDDICFAGYQSNPLAFLANAGLFVLSSNWEGMSNALLEAMACGCPIVATDCSTGVRELMDDGRIGPIVPLEDPNELAKAMSLRLAEPRGSAALLEFAARFDQERMLKAYELLFKSK